MHQYGVRDVERLLGLSRNIIRSLVDAGFVCPARGPRRSWRFSFRDLIVMRTAQTLVAAKVPRRTITRSIKALRRHLPEAMPLSGLSICAVGDRVVVNEGSRRWHAESGQYLLGFEGDPAKGTLGVVQRTPETSRTSARSWLDRGMALEEVDVEAALDAYRRAIAADPGLADAYVNSGWLLQEAGKLPEAELAYRRGIESCGAEPVLLYNLGVLLADMDRKSEALEAYEAAVRADASFADCHYNLALLYEELDRRREAIRHMAQYRRLTAKRPD
jgi:tetratricopeptide (TPR) repeat protein